MSGVASMPPAIWLIAAGLLVAVMRGRARSAVLLIAPLVTLYAVWQVPDGVVLSGRFMDYPVVPVEGNPLSRLFATIFTIMAFGGGLFALNQKNHTELAAAFVYGGSAVGVAFAGDLITVFVFWELMAVGSTIVVWCGQDDARRAGLRYAAIHLLGGVILMAGVAGEINATGSTAFTAMQPDSLSRWLILAGFLINAGAPPLAAWLPDAYPEASWSGMVFLSAFTTKTAVYVLLRGFPGTELLIYIGLFMVFYGIIYAILENDMRRILAYSIVNQVGFMICAIGVGTAGVGNALALNGAAAHAFCHIIYKGLLFMSMGAVLYRTGTTKASELGGLYKSMPWTTIFCIIGAMSISAFPLFSGFAAKSLTMSAVGKEGLTVVWLMLLFASAGVLEHSGIKIPYFAFFGHDSGKRVKEAPFNMLLAMGLAAFICIAVGVPAIVPGLGYEWLYNLLPYREEAMAYQPFTLDHVLTQMQLLVLAIFAFVMLKRLGWYPPEKPGVVLDSDWVYRKGGYGLVTWSGTVWKKAGPAMSAIFFRLAGRAYDRIEATFSPRGELARGGLNTGMATWTAILLGFVLLLSFITAG